MAKGKFSNPRPDREEASFPERAVSDPPAPSETEEPLSPFPVPETDAPVTPVSEEYPEDLELPEDFVDKALQYFHIAAEFCEKYRKQVLFGMCAAALVLLIGVIGIFFAGTADPYDGKILNNVLVGDVLVGGMTKEQAEKLLQKELGSLYDQPMVIDLAGNQLRLEAADIKPTLDLKTAVADAYSYGRTGSEAEREAAYQNSLVTNYALPLNQYLKLDESRVTKALDAYAKDLGKLLTQSSYGLEGDEPDLSTDTFDPKTQGQTLIITMGTPGVSFDPEAVSKQVVDAYKAGIFTVAVKDVQPTAEPDPLDLKQIHTFLFREPVEPAIDLGSYEPIPGAYGQGFDMETVQKLVDAAQYGQELRIPLDYTPPENAEGLVLYGDVLGTAKTPHSDNADRTANLRLACKAIHGLELNPGQSFSFNDVVGKRTESRGYRPAPSYADGELVNSVGGGICQVSTTLYQAVLLSELDVVSRNNHSYPVSYADMGLDATVSWGSPDFQFKNSSLYPIRIEAEVSGGYVTVRILGIDRRDYRVELSSKVTGTIEPEKEYEWFPYDNGDGYEDGDVIEEGVKGYYVKSYKHKYDKATGKQISQESITTSTYRAKKTLIARVDPPETEPTEAPTETTVPETTEPAGTTQPTSPTTESSAPTQTTQATEPSETTKATESTTAPTQGATEGQSGQSETQSQTEGTSPSDTTGASEGNG